MANKFTRYLSQFGKGLIGGLSNTKGIVSNWQHASRLYVDNTYRLSPRTKFLFYVRFEIDPTAHKAPAFTARHSNEAGLLVKSADLPKFTFDSSVINQYNRKKIVYKQINYDPVTITMHDDSAGVINALWAIYYGYYVADRLMPNAAYEANHLRKKGTIKDNFKYGLDNNITTPFFKSVSIYTMSRKRFTGYTLVNPRIKNWTHGNVNYSENETVESQMTLEYEAVQYSAGSVTFNNPKGFATLHYDSVPSPISIAGGGISRLTGAEGVLDGLEQIFGDVESGSAFSSVGGFIGTAVKAINTYKNIKGLSKEGLKEEAINILSNPAAIATAVSTVGGVVGAVFPKSAAASNTQTVTASPKVIATAAFTGQPVTAPPEQ